MGQGSGAQTNATNQLFQNPFQSPSQPGTGGSGTGWGSGAPGFNSQFSPLAAVNALAETPPGNSPIDAFMGTLFQNQGAAGQVPTGQAPGGGPSPNPAFGGSWMNDLLGLMYGFPGPVPTALAPYGTQSSLFGSMTGLGNPMLLPMLLMMMNRPTTTVPFDPPVQPGSPVATHGVFPFSGANPFFPTVGQPLPKGTTPPFTPVPPVPGGASNLPGRLPSSSQGPFQPSSVRPIPGTPVQDSPKYNPGIQYTIPNPKDTGGYPGALGAQTFQDVSSYSGGATRTVQEASSSDVHEDIARARIIQQATGGTVYVDLPLGQGTMIIGPPEPLR